jgi:seryl-tRNA synthetase
MHSKQARDNLKSVSARCNELLASTTSLEEDHEQLLQSINSIQHHFSEISGAVGEVETLKTRATVFDAKEKEINDLKAKFADAKEQKQSI